MTAAKTRQIGESQGVEVLGVNCLAADLDTAARHVLEMVRRGDGGYVSTCNVHVVVTANRDPEYRAALEGAALRVPDGWPVAWMQRRLGASSAQRIPGPDLMEHLLDIGRHGDLSHFMLGSTQPVLDQLVGQIMDRVPHVRLAGAYSPPFGNLGDGPDPQLIDLIRSSPPSIVWVGLGAPKQDFWMRMYAEALAPSVLIGVGAAFDFSAGARPRAPRWMRNSGLEWAHRLASEPGRLTGRYIRTNTAFLVAAGSQLLRRRNQ
jgi:N-acetylglucosaminyldiphosphoundecaprenol N-acetyl-beta-D-mannosaminyltransferase